MSPEPLFSWEDVDGDGVFLFLVRGTEIIGEIYPRAEGVRWHCMLSGRRQMEKNLNIARSNLMACAYAAAILPSGGDLDEMLHHMLVEADRPGLERVYILLAAASNSLRPGSDPDADPSLVADPGSVAREMEALAGLEEAKTSERDDGLVTELREIAAVLWSRMPQSPESSL